MLSELQIFLFLLKNLSLSLSVSYITGAVPLSTEQFKVILPYHTTNETKYVSRLIKRHASKSREETDVGREVGL